MPKNRTYAGILYFVIHFLIEVASFYILSFYMGTPAAVAAALVYDYLAFVPQGIYGWLSDLFPKFNFGILGAVLSLAALLMFRLRWNWLAVTLVIALGNGMIHIQGAEVTLHSSGGKMTPAALFVAGGSFGLITGKLMSGRIPVWPVMLLTLLIPVLILLAQRYRGEGAVQGFAYAAPGIGKKLLVGLAVFVVVVRAYMGYGIPTTWNQTVIQNVALYVCMGTGKALGGVLIDKIGIRGTAAISTLGALPFLLFGDQNMVVSLVGVLLFSMTMAVTLALIVSRMPESCGVAFGFTTLGLFLGTLPIFFFRITSVVVNCAVITVLSIACFLILEKICAKENKS